MHHARYLMSAVLSLGSLGCAAAQQAAAPPLEQVAWAAYVKGDSKTASTHADRCVAERSGGELDCAVLKGVIDSDNAKHEAAVQRFSDIRDYVFKRANRKGASEWDQFLLKSMLKREGLSQYRIGHFEKAIESLAAFDARRNGDESAFDISSELLAMSLYNFGQYSRAAEYLERYLASPEMTSAESYCWVTYNLSAINARLSMVEKSLVAAGRHLTRCDQRQFASDVKSDPDFQVVLKDPRFAALLSPNE